MLGLTKFVNLEEGARLTFKAQNGASKLFLLAIVDISQVAGVSFGLQYWV